MVSVFDSRPVPVYTFDKVGTGKASGPGNPPWDGFDFCGNKSDSLCSVLHGKHRYSDFLARWYISVLLSGRISSPPSEEKYFENAGTGNAGDCGVHDRNCLLQPDNQNLLGEY